MRSTTVVTLSLGYWSCHLASLVLVVTGASPYTSPYLSQLSAQAIPYTPPPTDFPPDQWGNTVPDFSQVGYRRGLVKLPLAPVVMTLQPSSDPTFDDRTRIQDAIDQVGQRPMVPFTTDDGTIVNLRGAILLQAGMYRVSGSLIMNRDGVVLRGEGNDANGTILVATGTVQRDFIHMNGMLDSNYQGDEDYLLTKGRSREMAPKDPMRVKDDIIASITNEYVPVGSIRIPVTDLSGFEVGQEIVVQRNSVAKWIEKIGMNNLPLRPDHREATLNWDPRQFVLRFVRKIRKIEKVKVSDNQKFTKPPPPKNRVAKAKNRQELIKDTRYEVDLLSVDLDAALSAIDALGLHDGSRMVAAHVANSTLSTEFLQDQIQPQQEPKKAKKNKKNNNNSNDKKNSKNNKGNSKDNNIGGKAKNNNKSKKEKSKNMNLNRRYVAHGEGSNMNRTDMQLIFNKTEEWHAKFDRKPTEQVQPSDTVTPNVNNDKSPFFAGVPGGSQDSEDETVALPTVGYLTLDIPLVMPIEPDLGGGTVYLLRRERRIPSDIGLENMQLWSEHDEENDEDEQHAWFSVMIDHCQNCWVSDVKSRYFVSGFKAGPGSKHVTIQDCEATDPVSLPTMGGRRYMFMLHGQMGLIKRCFASSGRHDFITGAKTSGPNVFVDSEGEEANNDSGPHDRLSSGTLFDNIHSKTIAVRNRGWMGSGQGWAGIFHVIYRCTAGQTRNFFQSPPGGTNWVIGFEGLVQESAIPFPGDDAQYLTAEAQDGPMPRSLYWSQLVARLATSTGATTLTGWNETAAVVESYVGLGGRTIYPPPLERAFFTPPTTDDEEEEDNDVYDDEVENENQDDNEENRDSDLGEVLEGLVDLIV